MATHADKVILFNKLSAMYLFAKKILRVLPHPETILPCPVLFRRIHSVILSSILVSLRFFRNFVFLAVSRYFFAGFISGPWL